MAVDYVEVLKDLEARGAIPVDFKLDQYRECHAIL